MGILVGILIAGGVVIWVLIMVFAALMSDNKSASDEIQTQALWIFIIGLLVAGAFILSHFVHSANIHW